MSNVDGEVFARIPLIVLWAAPVLVVVELPPATTTIFSSAKDQGSFIVVVPREAPLIKTTMVLRRFGKFLCSKLRVQLLGTILIAFSEPPNDDVCPPTVTVYHALLAARLR